jgi:hypothetical protein
MAGHSRPKDGVASLAYVPAIHALFRSEGGVDARHKAGHDELWSSDDRTVV